MTLPLRPLIWLSVLCLQGCYEEPIKQINLLKNTEEFLLFVPKEKQEKIKPYQEPSDKLAVRLTNIQKRYLPKARPLTTFVEGELEEGESDVSYLFLMGFHSDGRPRCYHFFALSEDDRNDLDIEIFEPRTSKRAIDNQVDFYPMIRYLCPYMISDVRITIRMAQGRGRYIFRAFRYDELDMTPDRLFTR